MKKKNLNKKRRRKELQRSEGLQVPPVREEVMKHLQMMISQIEGRPVSREEILAAVERKMRQHSMAQKEKADKMPDTT